MNDEQLLRYSRHLLLQEIDVVGQEKLLNSHVLVIGCGGLGSAATPYLAAAGIGRITVIDHDQVDLTNLQRQIIYTANTVGQDKVLSAKAFLEQRNPDAQIQAITSKANSELLDALLPDVNVVLDCTDNFLTRQMINAACVQHRVPLVSGSALGLDGQLSVFDTRDEHSPCYACIFTPELQPEEVSCSSMGIFSPLVGIIGSMQAAQCLQLLIGFGKPLLGRLLLWNGRTTQIDQISVARNPDCVVCGQQH